MDCLITSHQQVKYFCQMLTCAAKTSNQKDLYWVYDPVRGLTLRALNETQSAYICFELQPGFFARCSASTESIQQLRHSKKSNNKKRTKPADDDDDDDRFSCRVAAKSLFPIVKARPNKTIQSLRVTTQLEKQWLLCFTFTMQHGGAGAGGGGSGAATTCWTVTHSLPVAAADAVAAVATTRGKSTAVASCRTWRKLIVPLLQSNKNRHEMALVVHNNHPSSSSSSPPGVVEAASFSSLDVQRNNSNTTAMPKATRTLKTETAVSVEEWHEIDYVTDYSDGGGKAPPQELPVHLDQYVVLVCSLRELGALLQLEAGIDEESLMALHFTFGGQPLVWTVDAGLVVPHVTVQLVLATLDHGLLEHYYTADENQHGSSVPVATAPADTATTPAAAVATE